MPQHQHRPRRATGANLVIGWVVVAFAVMVGLAVLVEVLPEILGAALAVFTAVAVCSAPLLLLYWWTGRV